MNDKTTNGVIENPNGVHLPNGETLHYGHTLDVISEHRLEDGAAGFIVQPHGYEFPCSILAEDVHVYETY